MRSCRIACSNRRRVGLGPCYNRGRTLNGTGARLAGLRAPVPLPVERQLEGLVIGGLYFALDRVVGPLLLQVALLEGE